MGKIRCTNCNTVLTDYIRCGGKDLRFIEHAREDGTFETLSEHA